MKLILGFLYSRRRIAAVILTSAAVYVIFMVICGVPKKAVLYSSVICAAITAFAAAGDFLRYFFKVRRLKAMQDEVLFTLEHLPSPDSGTEREYRKLLRTLFEENAALRSEAFSRYDSALIYFTMWAHQIKTPIASMSLTLGEFDSPQSAELSEELQKIEQYAEMALYYVRLNGSADDFVFREYSLDKIIKQAVRRFSSQFIRKRIKLVYEPVKIKVITDEKWLLFVIEQVISNALKYTKSGSVEISENLGVLFVRDTGIGIAPEDLPRVFERGFTGINGRIDKSSTGIGLYLCKRICDKLGHGISANSDAGGTEIQIDLSTNNADTRD